MTDDLRTLLRDHGGLDGLARELGQFDPIQIDMHGPDEDARPSIALWIIVAIVAAFFLWAFAWPASAAVACGDRGGPGYRLISNQQCLKWLDVARGVCGCPPTALCLPERLHAGAEKVAKLRCKIRG
jgi:hypothetical protein